MSVVESEYGTISNVLVSGREEGSVLYLGGWRQNPNLMFNMQEVLANLGFSSVGISAFDTINPTSDVESEFKSDPLCDGIPPRMLRRAAILNQLSRSMLFETIQPTQVLTHCAGANVLLLAKYVSSTNGEVDILPNSGVLAEPMIREGADMTSRDYFVPFAKHEKAAKKDLTLISLSAMSPESDKSPTIAEGIRPLDDIVNSKGSTMLGKALNGGADFRLVLGVDDCAANLDALTVSLDELGLDLALTIYKDQQRTGHGYLLAEPEAALRDIAPILAKSTEA